MKEKTSFAQSYDQLPHILPIFPLSGAVVLPGGILALNIFEPRYLNMIQDAMKTDQLIGMIQPKDDLNPPNLHKVGCAARIVHYSETQDHRLEISLHGLCRFSVIEELSCMRGYRLIKPSWNEYEHDFSNPSFAEKGSAQLFSNALRRYFEHKNIDVDWPAVESVEHTTLMNNLISQLPLSDEDKQLLIEASTIDDRVKSFTAILAGTEDHIATLH